MPLILQHIDKIARDKHRDVLYIEFQPGSAEQQTGYDYENDDARIAVLDWFDQNDIPWIPCGEYADPCRMSAYRGQVYVDIPFDESLPEYQRLRDFLENPDGTMRRPGVHFCALSLEFAMKNAAHDEPGYWEAWAENF